MAFLPRLHCQLRHDWSDLVRPQHDHALHAQRQYHISSAESRTAAAGVIPAVSHQIARENLGSREDEKVAATIYGVALLGAMVLLSLLWLQAVRADLVHPDTGDEEIKLLTARLRPSLAVYIVLIIVGLFTPLIATIGYLVVAFFLIFPLNRRRRQKAEPALG